MHLNKETRMSDCSRKYFVRLLMLILLIEAKGDLSPPPQNIKIGLEIAIDYFNKSSNIADRLEMVQKYYEFERDAGIFMPARTHQPPAQIEYIKGDLESIESSLKVCVENGNGKLHPEDEFKLIQNLKKIQINLERNFGPFDRVFRVTGPMELNVRAVRKMREYFDNLMKEFKDYSAVQYQFTTQFHVLYKFGIKLDPKDNPSFTIFTTKEKLDEILKEQKKTRKDIPQMGMDYLINLIPKYKPKETSEEILALQNLQYGKSLEEFENEMLLSYVEKCNKKAYFIIGHMKSLENIVMRIEEESDEYGDILSDKREELYQLLFKLKKRFGFEPQDWAPLEDWGTPKDQSTKDEL